MTQSSFSEKMPFLSSAQASVSLCIKWISPSWESCAGEFRVFFPGNELTKPPGCIPLLWLSEKTLSVETQRENFVLQRQ